MNFLYWNIRGISNTPSRLALRRLISKNKPDFIFLAEPWMKYEDFPANWFSRLGFKLFSMNHREKNIPNLWCFCSFSSIMLPSI